MGDAKEQLEAKITATAKGSTGAPRPCARSTAIGVNSTAVALVLSTFESSASSRKKADSTWPGVASAMACISRRASSAAPPVSCIADRNSGGSGKGVSVRVNFGGRRILKNKKEYKNKR